MPSRLYKHPRLFKTFLNVYPPYWGTGIRVTALAADFSRMDVRMDLRWYNRNAFGTQFGGSLYSMCDPHWVLLLVGRLGPGYEVWDKAASVEFLKPGRGAVFASFEWSQGQVDDIRRALADGARSVHPERTVDITDSGGRRIARVHKTLYVRHRRDKPPPGY
ncbi:DUF4442 domain-containing protein [Abyssibacter sp.]|uniref:DUF4442 domain-containing protein n=1 Tax=Abyssibacter sp. TaxID=2320200 RepID=UPI000C4D9CA6|nr:tetrameric acyl-CoA thioesterase [Xanthomonadales bacterium]